MKTQKIIEQGEKEFEKEFPTTYVKHEQGGFESTVYIKDFISHQNKQIIEAVLSDVGDIIECDTIRCGACGGMACGHTLQCVYKKRIQSHLTKLKEELR